MWPTSDAGAGTISGRTSVAEREPRDGRAVVRQRHGNPVGLDETTAREMLAGRRQAAVAERPLDRAEPDGTFVEHARAGRCSSEVPPRRREGGSTIPRTERCPHARPDGTAGGPLRSRPGARSTDRSPRGSASRTCSRRRSGDRGSRSAGTGTLRRNLATLRLARAETRGSLRVAPSIVEGRSCELLILRTGPHCATSRRLSLARSASYRGSDASSGARSGV